ncbi:MAG: DUF4826 family protein [Armatimonadota bacterium]
MADPINFDDPQVEGDWCAQQREHVEWFLDQQPIQPGRIGEWPAFHIAPHVAIWAIESGEEEDLLGWWVITGDLPTDYFSAMELHHPREVLAAAADRWQMLLDNIKNGVEDDSISLPGLAENLELQEILNIRVKLLRKTYGMDDFWIQFDKDFEDE